MKFSQSLLKDRSALVLRAGICVAFLAACTDKESSTIPPDTASGHDSGDTPSTEPPCADQADTFEAVLAFMTQELEDYGVPGGSIAVVCDGKLAFSAGVGWTEAGGTAPVTPDTRFQVASVTKMFTAATAMSMVEDGLVSLDAPVSDVLPSINTIAPYETPATLHHLLSHTAGYPTQYPSGVWTSYELATFFENNRDQPLWSPPGALFNYSNLGMSLAGLTLEVAADTRFGTLVEERVFSPAGMTRATMFIDTVLSDGDYARGHTGDPATPTVIAPDGSYYHTGYYGPMGGAWTSATDLVRWAEVHLADGGKVMRPESMDRLRADHTQTGRMPGQTHGYSLFKDTVYGGQVLSHNGSVPGYMTDWQLVPAEGFAVAVIVNGDWYGPRDITDHALHSFGVRGELDTSMYVYDTGEWGDLVGVYEDANVYGTIIVTQTSAGLQADFVDRGFVSPLTPSFDQTFNFVDAEWGIRLQLIFWRDGDSGPARYVSSPRGVGVRTTD
jgi:CubicO group peptidase (beta-lactamase class C family)